MRKESTNGTETPGGQRSFRFRFFFLKVAFALAFLLVGMRLVVLQVLEAPRYRAMAKKQYEQTFVLPATRGIVVDRNGNVLVSNTMFISIAADPKIVGERATTVATQLSKVTGRARGEYLARLREERRFVWLERRVNPAVARRIEAAKIEGIVLVNEPKRIYHYDDLAGTLVGFTNVDNKGISGVELALDSVLRGTNGSIVMHRDGLNRVRPSADHARIEPVNGEDIVLTIDLKYQAIAEEELKRGLQRSQAEAGMVVMVEPKTGEILALAVQPCVNPNAISGVDLALTRNRVVADVFEPGSVFKLVTATAAYDQGNIRPESRWYAEKGTFTLPVGKKEKQTITDTHPHEWVTFEEAMAVSSNIVMAKVGKQLGAERLFRFARAFGFGTPTGIDIPGEVRGQLKRTANWSGTTLQAMSYGYEVGVTPLQILCAYAAVANNGVLMKPYVVSGIRGSDGSLVRINEPLPVRRVATADVVGLLRSAFEQTVQVGTGTMVRMDGVRIAGKTGTSRKLVDGKYSLKDYTASFVGFYPAEDPQVACLVMLDNPRGRSYYGGETSGPVFKAIAERVIHTSERFSRAPIAENLHRKNGPVAVPDVRTLEPAMAVKMLESHGLRGTLFGKGEIVLKQSPEPGRKAEPGDAVSLILEGSPSKASDGSIVVPDVRGLSIRRAMNRLVAEDFDVSARGSGVVVQQIPSAGQRSKPGAEIVLVCEPRKM
ncbi:MAG: penicillin-binding transpeptidase domain-containing protein [Bacteroidetes bacterium]|jgi:cell division protein FtsI/penicillin-binding protein 2|nr:penicillin-binding transpeptidase domain-containing protein [Bacteroidota bacterium]